MAHRKLIKMKSSICSDITLNNAAEMYLDRCRAENLSEASITTYRRKWKRFLAAFGIEPVSYITKDRFEGWKSTIVADDSIKDHTKASIIRHARTLMYYCMDEGYIDAYHIRQIKVEEMQKPVFSDDELSDLLQMPRTKSFPLFRTWAIVCFLAGTGCRISSAQEVRVSDVDTDIGYVYFRKNKNRKAYKIKIDAPMIGAIQCYLQVRGGSDDDYFFCTEAGERLSINYMQRKVREYNAAHGIIAIDACHQYRRTYATYLARKGINAYQLKERLGQSSITISQKYVNLAEQEQTMVDSPLQLMKQQMPRKRIRMK